MRLRSFAGLATVIGAITACSSGTDVPASRGPVARTFETSARANVVPRDLLIAIAHVEGGLALPATRDVDPDNNVPAAGPLMLRHGKLDTLSRGAKLMGVTELELRRDTDLALEAGARVLAEVGARTGATRDDLASWEPALEEMSGYADAPHRADYARRVLAALAKGGTYRGRASESIVALPHASEIPAALVDLSHRIEASGTSEYPGAQWFPTDCTGKCDTTRGGNVVEEIVIHDTEGGWDASVATLQNDAGKSVQYIVGTDGAIGQFVPESYTAWHAGNYYVNQRSVGIEHVGYSTQPYTEAQYAASAALVGYLADKYGVAKDRAHVFGHDQVPNGNLIAESAPACADSPSACEASSDYGGAGNHRDPGVWEWPTYMPRFGGVAKCDDAFPLWNCSYDHSKAIRCSSGVVEVDTCDGAGACVTEANGVDDICNHAPVQPGDDAGSSEDASAPVNGGDAGSISHAPPPIMPGDTSNPPPSGASAPQDANASSGGCSATPRSRSGDGALVFVMALGIVLATRRRKPATTNR